MRRGELGMALAVTCNSWTESRYGSKKCNKRGPNRNELVGLRALR